MQVGAGDAAGGADGAENVAGFDHLTGLHRDAVHVAVHGDEPLAVVEVDGVAVVVEIAGGDDAAGGGGADRGAGGGGEVDAAVRVARLAVEEAAQAEGAAVAAFHGQGEAGGDGRGRLEGAVGLAAELEITGDAFLIFRAGIDHARRHLEVLLFVFLGAYLEGEFAIGTGGGLYPQGVATGPGAEGDAHDGLPLPSILQHHDPPALVIRLRRALVIAQRHDGDAAGNGGVLREGECDIGAKQEEQTRQQDEVQHNVGARFHRAMGQGEPQKPYRPINRAPTTFIMSWLATKGVHSSTPSTRHSRRPWPRRACTCCPVAVCVAARSTLPSAAVTMA